MQLDPYRLSHRGDPAVIDHPRHPALAFESVSKSYGQGGRRVQVLNDVSFAVNSGEIVWLRGPSGGGKSSVLRIAGLLSQPSQGRVTLAGRDASATNWSGKERVAAVGIAFQSGNLLGNLSLKANLEVTALTANLPRIPQLFDQWGLANIQHRKARLVSGGELQRAALCRALVNNPQLLLADEPTSALDADNASRVLDALRRTAGAGTAVLVASHDERVASVAHRVINLTGGAIA